MLPQYIVISEELSHYFAIETSMLRNHLPVIDKDNFEFWTGGASGKLIITQCQNCNLYIHPHSDICRRCHSRDLAPAALSGRGVISTYTINHQVWEPGLETPYTVAIVTLEEQDGLNLTTNIVNCDPADVRIGMPVTVVFEQVEDVWLPLFEPSPART
ncbi:Zn-ribbon domain-containing OB-fold protein [Hyphomonas sp.]|uniref:Zn-ribbon domain-containing OB-fold protein n=1 Tax=Hyphomonas sp. TaxID=87 RepID=UPI0032D9A64D